MTGVQTCALPIYTISWNNYPQIDSSDSTLFIYYPERDLDPGDSLKIYGLYINISADNSRLADTLKVSVVDTLNVYSDSIYYGVVDTQNTVRIGDPSFLMSESRAYLKDIGTESNIRTVRNIQRSHSKVALNKIAERKLLGEKSTLQRELTNKYNSDDLIRIINRSNNNSRVNNLISHSLPKITIKVNELVSSLVNGGRIYIKIPNGLFCDWDTSASQINKTFNGATSKVNTTQLHFYGDSLWINVIDDFRSEEHTSELQSHSFISYAVFCLKKKNKSNNIIKMN